jgi:hypothetical protein
MELQALVCARRRKGVEKEGRSWVEERRRGGNKSESRAWGMIAWVYITLNNYYLSVLFEWESVRIPGRAEEVEEKKEVRAEKGGMGRAL